LARRCRTVTDFGRDDPATKAGKSIGHRSAIANTATRGLLDKILKREFIALQHRRLCFGSCAKTTAKETVAIN
jgi:hypothetical protein